MNATDATLPDVCSIAFKEWEGVCRALARGRQSLILRKGGIDEGPAGFAPEHSTFWLYPTKVHQAEQGLKPEVAEPSAPLDIPSGMIPIDTMAVVEWIERIESLESLSALDRFHVWTRETIEKRFYYRTPGLWVLGVRIYCLREPVPIEITPEHAGCKTWVPLDHAIEKSSLTPVLDDSAFRAEVAAIRAALSSARFR